VDQRVVLSRHLNIKNHILSMAGDNKWFNDIGTTARLEEGPFVLSECIIRDQASWSLYATIVQRKDSLTKKLPVLLLLHGGGPDHHSLLPLAKKLANINTVILPDIRGYGQSVCTDPVLHTWAQYSNDVVELLDRMGISTAIVGGAGLGGTIALRTALAFPTKVNAVVVISVEDIEDDEAKKAEILFMEEFAHRVRTFGIEAAWDPILKDLSPVIGAMVRDAIPRSNPESIAAAAAIGYDRSFKNVYELAEISVPTLIIPGIDWRHPKAFAEKVAAIIPKGTLAPVTLSGELQTADDFAETFVPVIADFLITHNAQQR
jgi:3-oxoadipate enol-lactonase